ncbi:MAG: cobaltochelatase subunit CobN, partial [Candidatus Puniceispirillaceae bacterium]
MHLPRVEDGGALYDSGEAVDLDQPPGDIIFLTSADTEVSLLSAAASRFADVPGTSATTIPATTIPAIRIANYLSLSHPFSVDNYLAATVAGAKLVLVRLLGGTGYWSYGVQQLRALADRGGPQVVFLAGDGKPDPELDYLSSLAPGHCHALAAYLDSGGPDNALAFLMALRDLCDGTDLAPPAAPLLRAGIYWPGHRTPDLTTLRANWRDGAPVAAITFYRALMQAADLAPVDVMIEACIDAGLNPLPLFSASLKDGDSAAVIADLLRQAQADVILNMTSFAVSDPAQGDHGMPDMRSAGPFGAVDAPVFQLVLSASLKDDWQSSGAGLTPRDLAMNVALPELDGRVLTRAVGFKRPPSRHPVTHAMTTAYEAVPERARFTARLAANWARLRQIGVADRKVALIMANYPNRDGRIANGVGLDTPASVFAAMRALGDAGYAVQAFPDDSAGLIAQMKAGPTNAGWQGRDADVSLPLQDYERHFAALPEPVRRAVIARWGAASADPMCDGDNLHLPLRRYGHVIVGIQPARGYNIDPKSTYHSPDLVPPHNYFALYIWLREIGCVDAVVHFGKHGNLEWLPGKALALSEACFPEAVLGPVPHLYPFIVNDPGEGAQAKRRTAAVILDHLTPPMTQADSHGVMAELEAQMDEYFEAAGMDRARSDALLGDILDTAMRAGIAQDCGIDDADDPGEQLLKLDNYLCDLKELQIRDGLHVYGSSPGQELANGLLAQILRTPRGDGDGANGSLIRALARDLGLGDAARFDPLTSERGLAWDGPRPASLDELSDNPWRSHGDTVERLDALALALVAGSRVPPGPASAAVIDTALADIRSRLAACGPRETDALIRALDGRFVPAGASGAPTRGRPEVLPTGRNFFSIDSRALPTPVAWRLGWASAEALLDRHLMDHGNWPRAVVLSAWG